MICFLGVKLQIKPNTAKQKRPISHKIRTKRNSRHPEKYKNGSYSYKNTHTFCDETANFVAKILLTIN